MAELSRAAPSDVSRIAVLGASLKMEVVELSPASGASVAQGDTFVSRLQNPQFGFAFENGDNTTGASGLTLQTDQNSSNEKEVLINVTGSSLNNDVNITAVVFGT